MKISFRQNQCIDQRLFNVKETTQRVTVTVRGEDRDSYSRGARIQLDGSTDVNGEREREREIQWRDLCTRAHCRIYHRNRCVPLWSVTEEACAGGGGRVADALNQLAASRENPARESPPRGEGEGPGDRSLSAVASHPLPPAYIFLSGNAPPPPPHHLHTLELRDCTRK